MIGLELGSYRITAKLGAGGMGAVYRAEHTKLGSSAAIKVLLPEYCRDEELVGRFFNEAKAAAAIDHPGIIGVFDFGSADDGSAYIVMEYLGGESLGTRLARVGRLSAPQVATIGRLAAGALAAAHRKGIIHRDLKPDNIVMVEDPDIPGGERPKIVDFGIAKLTAPGASGTRTRTGAIMGTPLYMSPEQCRGAERVDHRADIYSLGCVLYDLACGRPPFVFDGPGEVMIAHLERPPPAPTEIAPDVPRWLEQLLQRMLAKEPILRPQSMGEVAAALEEGEAEEARAPSGEPIPGRDGALADTLPPGTDTLPPGADTLRDARPAGARARPGDADSIARTAPYGASPATADAASAPVEGDAADPGSRAVQLPAHSGGSAPVQAAAADPGSAPVQAAAADPGSGAVQLPAHSGGSAPVQVAAADPGSAPVQAAAADPGSAPVQAAAADPGSGAVQLPAHSGGSAPVQAAAADPGSAPVQAAAADPAAAPARAVASSSGARTTLSGAAGAKANQQPPPRRRILPAIATVAVAAAIAVVAIATHRTATPARKPAADAPAPDARAPMPPPPAVSPPAARADAAVPADAGARPG